MPSRSVQADHPRCFIIEGQRLRSRQKLIMSTFLFVTLVILTPTPTVLETQMVVRCAHKTYWDLLRSSCSWLIVAMNVLIPVLSNILSRLTCLHVPNYSFFPTYLQFPSILPITSPRPYFASTSLLKHGGKNSGNVLSPLGVIIPLSRVYCQFPWSRKCGSFFLTCLSPLLEVDRYSRKPHAS